MITRPGWRRSAALMALGAVALAACSPRAYQPSYGFMLETTYGGVIPAGQQSALTDGVLTEQEVNRATDASDACVAAVAGIASAEPFRWVEQEGEFLGGDLVFEDGADREGALEAASACYFEHLALIEFAWFDQLYFGEWTDENLRD